MQRAIYGDPTEPRRRGYLHALKAEGARRSARGRIRPTHFWCPGDDAARSERIIRRIWDGTITLRSGLRARADRFDGRRSKRCVVRRPISDMIRSHQWQSMMTI